MFEHGSVVNFNGIIIMTMKLFLTFLITFCTLSLAQTTDKKADIPDNLKIERLKLQVKVARLQDQFKQLQLSQQDVAKQFSELQPSILKNTNDLKAFCEASKLEFQETLDEISCAPKKIEKKEEKDKK